MDECEGREADGPINPCTRSPNQAAKGLERSATRKVGCTAAAAAHDAHAKKPTGNYVYNMRKVSGTTRVTELEREHAMEADENDRATAVVSWRVEPPTIEPG